MILELQRFWAGHGRVRRHRREVDVDVEVGAGASHPATLLRVLGPEPRCAAFAQPCRRSLDGRHGADFRQLAV
jgi:glycyl-tRNA synthetase alpha chain